MDKHVPGDIFRIGENTLVLVINEQFPPSTRLVPVIIATGEKLLVPLTELRNRVCNVRDFDDLQNLPENVFQLFLELLGKT